MIFSKINKKVLKCSKFNSHLYIHVFDIKDNFQYYVDGISYTLISKNIEKLY